MAVLSPDQAVATTTAGRAQRLSISMVRRDPKFSNTAPSCQQTLVWPGRGPCCIQYRSKQHRTLRCRAACVSWPTNSTLLHRTHVTCALCAGDRHASHRHVFDHICSIPIALTDCSGFGLVSAVQLVTQFEMATGLHHPQSVTQL
jgi:hypothetical protein